MTLQQKLDICDLHLSRLTLAHERIKRYYPFKESDFPLNNIDDLAYLDMFTTRFAKLQDYMGESLFPTYLKFLDENINSLSMIDRLNMLEKYRILESAARWRELRDLRNKISHEYPHGYAEQCITLNKIIDCYSYLETILNSVKSELKKHEYTT